VRLEPVVRDGTVVADPVLDLSKVAVIERTGEVRVGMLRGAGLARGALGLTTAAAPGDLIVIGTDDDDMLSAARSLEGMGGGFVAVERGWVRAACPLPVASALSDAPWEAALAQLAAVDAAASHLGCRLPTPFLTLSALGRHLYTPP
jgi:adenine deaminase